MYNITELSSSCTISLMILLVFSITFLITLTLNDYKDTCISDVDNKLQSIKQICRKAFNEKKYG